MKILQFPLLLCFVFAFSCLCFGQKSEPRSNRKPARKTVPPAAQNGLLYKISEKISGKTLPKPSYLFGTIHVICPGDLFGMAKLTRYFKQTDRLVLELDMDNPDVTGKMLTALNMPQGKTLRDYLTAEQYAKVDEMFKSILGVPVGMLSQFSPLGLSVAISMSPKATGCLTPDSYEMNFVRLAAETKKPVEGLETVEDQVAALNKTPIEKQAEHLYKMALEPQKAINQFKDLLSAYKLQDSEKLIELIAAQSAENEQYKADLLDERNKNWIPKIENLIGEKPTFIAVGAGHLGGPNGVVNLLRKKGFTVTAIRF